MIIGEVARNIEVPLRQTMCERGIVDGLDVNEIIDLARRNDQRSSRGEVAVGLHSTVDIGAISLTEVYN